MGTRFDRSEKRQTSIVASLSAEPLSKRVGCAHQPSVRNRARSPGAYVLLRSWHASSQCSEMSRSPRPPARRCGALFGHASAPPPRAARRWGRGLRGSGTFFVWLAHTDPKKVPGVFMDPLADAICRASEWLKSSSNYVSKIVHVVLSTPCHSPMIVDPFFFIDPSCLTSP